MLSPVTQTAKKSNIRCEKIAAIRDRIKEITNISVITFAHNPHIATRKTQKTAKKLSV